MKKSTLLISMFSAAVFFLSCTSTLQEDIYGSTQMNHELEAEISNYEDEFIKLDSTYSLTGKIDDKKIQNLQKQIDKHLADEHIEPSISARLQAIQGLLCLWQNKTKKAQDYYSNAKTLQGGDSYVLLLGIRLCPSLEEQLTKADEIFSFNDSNATVLFEIGKLNYKAQNFEKAIASFDLAFLITEADEFHDYRNYYEPIRQSAWELQVFSYNKINNVDLNSLTDSITLKDMVEITNDNTALLQDITFGGYIKTNDLINKMTLLGYFSAPTDENNYNQTADELINASFITRKQVARYLWNLYLIKKGSSKQRTKYSSRYSRMVDAVSPISDIKITDIDLDAILGTVEAEIMELPDGKNFNPDAPVTKLELITYLGRINEK